MRIQFPRVSTTVSTGNCSSDQPDGSGLERGEGRETARKITPAPADMAGNTHATDGYAWKLPPPTGSGLSSLLGIAGGGTRRPSDVHARRQLPKKANHWPPRYARR